MTIWIIQKQKPLKIPSELDFKIEIDFDLIWTQIGSEMWLTWNLI